MGALIDLFLDAKTQVKATCGVCQVRRAEGTTCKCLKSLDRQSGALTKSGCVLFTGTPSHEYGRIQFMGVPRIVQRAAWEIFFGKIPAGKHVLHGPACPKRCVNAAHFKLGNHSHNMGEDRRAAGTPQRGRGQGLSCTVILTEDERDALNELAELEGKHRDEVLRKVLDSFDLATALRGRSALM